VNEKKICFIMCVNNKLYEEECIRYIHNLHIPEGYEVEQLSVWDAESMAAGYNEALHATDAKYKVYLHQDVFIIHKNFIYEMLKVFENQEVGAMGIVGSPKLPKDGIMWSGNRIGRILSSNIKDAGEVYLDTVKCPYQEVEAIDGLLIATQYDVPWRADVFTGWDFYDISQSMEMRKAGYKVVVPYMEWSWVLHDAGMVNLENYFKWKEVFLKEYGEYKESK